MSQKKPHPISPAEFARQIGYTRQAVSKAIKTGVLPTVKSGDSVMVNPGDRIVVEYARNALYVRGKEQKKAKTKKPVEDKGKKKAKAEKPVEVTENDIPVYLKKMADSGDLLFEQFIGLTKTEADKIKIYEQLKQIRVKTQREKKELISRKLVRVQFGKIYEIYTNEFQQIKTKIVPDIAGIMGCTDASKMIEADKKIDEELWRVRKHIKIEIDKFLKRMGGEYE